MSIIFIKKSSVNWISNSFINSSYSPPRAHSLVSSISHLSWHDQWNLRGKVWTGLWKRIVQTSSNVSHQKLMI